jgi:cytidyltransferase-like protein
MNLYSFDEFVNESMVTVKRKYTDNHPAWTTYGNLNKRNSVMKAIVDKKGSLTEEEINGFFGNKHNSSRWFKYNKRYISIEEDKDGNKIYKLTKHGQRLFDTLNPKTNDVSEEEKMVKEALTVTYSEPGQNKVNIFVGRFQPFTLGHVKVFEQMHKENGLPCVVLLVRGKKVDKEKSPFDEDTQITMFEKMKKEYSFLEAIFVIPTAAIDVIFNTLRPTYEPVLWGYGTDRKKAYDYQIENAKYREALNVLDDFHGYEIKRSDEDISASKVRQALLLDDENLYKSLVPKSLYDQFDVLKNIINSI